MRASWFGARRTFRHRRETGIDDRAQRPARFSRPAFIGRRWWAGRGGRRSSAWWCPPATRPRRFLQAAASLLTSCRPRRPPACWEDARAPRRDVAALGDHRTDHQRSIIQGVLGRRAPAGECRRSISRHFAWRRERRHVAPPGARACGSVASHGRNACNPYSPVGRRIKWRQMGGHRSAFRPGLLAQCFIAAWCAPCALVFILLATATRLQRSSFRALVAAGASPPLALATTRILWRRPAPHCPPIGCASPTAPCGVGLGTGLERGKVPGTQLTGCFQHERGCCGFTGGAGRRRSAGQEVAFKAGDLLAAPTASATDHGGAEVAR